MEARHCEGAARGAARGAAGGRCGYVFDEHNTHSREGRGRQPFEVSH